jgi:hypothetical protein
MNRDAKRGDVPKHWHHFGGVEQLAGDIRKHLKAPETELPNTAIHLGNGPAIVSKADAAQTDEPVRMDGDNLREVVVDPCSPLVGFLAE